jgi:DNA-directed RNA polymerase specialized sigma24 family protein
MYRHCDEVEGLVNETLGEALVLLRRGAGSGEHRWNRNGGASLTTYFVGTCVRTFPTVFRRWRGDLRRRPVTQSDSADECASHEFVSGYDVEGQVISEIFTRKRLDTIPPKVRRIVELRMEGFSYAEIAELTGARSSKAVEGVLQRYRDMLRRRGEGGQQ